METEKTYRNTLIQKTDLLKKEESRREERARRVPRLRPSVCIVAMSSGTQKALHTAGA